MATPTARELIEAQRNGSFGNDNHDRRIDRSNAKRGAHWTDAGYKAPPVNFCSRGHMRYTKGCPDCERAAD